MNDSGVVTPSFSTRSHPPARQEDGAPCQQPTNEDAEDTSDTKDTIKLRIHEGDRTYGPGEYQYETHGEHEPKEREDCKLPSTSHYSTPFRAVPLSGTGASRP